MGALVFVVFELGRRRRKEARSVPLGSVVDLSPLAPCFAAGLPVGANRTRLRWFEERVFALVID
jgi:hypothetical protein